MIIQRLRDLLKGGSRIVQRQRTPTQSGKLADLDRRQQVCSPPASSDSIV